MLTNTLSESATSAVIEWGVDKIATLPSLRRVSLAAPNPGVNNAGAMGTFADK